jgi:hypothetical protein
MKTFYVIPAATIPDTTQQTRARALTASLIVGDPSGLVTAHPSVVVMSPALASVVIPDDTGQATLAEVQTAQTNATNAETTLASNRATIIANITSAANTVNSWIAANPTGAVLTAGETLVLAQLLNGIFKVLLEDFTSTSGT